LTRRSISEPYREEVNELIANATSATLYKPLELILAGLTYFNRVPAIAVVITTS